MTFPNPIADRRRVLGQTILLAIGLGCVGAVAATDDATEHARLAAALRQLDMLERLVVQGADRPPPGQARYHFDYARLTNDLERVRAGIRDYLTPQRAQPRDPVVLQGDYRQEAEPEAAP